MVKRRCFEQKSADPTPVSYGDSTWGDLLTSYKGHSISYDEIGNPDNLYVNGHDYVMTWTTGRRLAAMTNSAGNEYYTFTYNDEGIRTSKTAYGTTHNYLLSGSQIIAEDLGNILLVYLYDENGSPMGMQYRTSSMNEGAFYTYWFEKNLQGDIIAVYNESGTKLISYTYDAWGNVTQTVHNHAGSNSYAGYNPFRYRGYYYDTETKLYYLQSRYYSPEIGRFINADGQLNGGLLGYNQFAYCENNPVNYIDPYGNDATTRLGITAIILGIIALIAPAVDGPLPVGDAISVICIGAVVGVGVTAITLSEATAIEPVLSIPEAEYKEISEASTKPRTYSVCFLEDKDGIVRYVGRVTDDGYYARMKYHESTRGLTPKMRIPGLSYEAARGLEEIGMQICHTINRDNPVYNQIHGISARNKHKRTYYSNAVNYLLNKAEDTVLSFFDW